MTDDVTMGWVTHNWIHHNYISTRVYYPASCEGQDALDIGNDGYNGALYDDNNTVEYNYIEYGGHATMAVNSHRNVVVGNTVHNEPWKPSCTVWQTSTSASSVAVGTGSRTFTTQAGLSYSALGPIAIVSAGDYGQALNGQVTSYDSGTGSLVVNVQRAVGSGTYSSWIVSYGHNIPQYDQAPYQNLFGHRNIGVGDPYNTDDHLNLIEGNRMGFASTNPNNDGSDNLTFTGHKNLARYNVLYGAMGTGIYFKWPYTGTYPGPGGVKNYVYNNTIYHSGYGWNPKLYGGGNLAYRGQGIGQNDYSATVPTNNVIKNNIVYGNSQGDICVIGWPGNATCSPALLSGGTPYDIVVNNWVTTGGDPKFVNPDLTDPTSQSLFSSVHGYTATPIPNLSLQSGSGAINAGVALTTASGAGASSTALVVADAMYFQDGSWGSDLARGVTLFPDWIAIGTVGNVVQVSSINYSTNTITLASPMTWSDGASVWLYKKSDGAVVLSGSAPDLGASEYISGTLMLGTFRGAIQ
jgi:hypothetical protein